MTVEEIWGVPVERARSFFAAQRDVDSQGDGFVFQSCRISLAALAPGRMGHIPFPRTLLRIEGPEAEAKSIHRRFLIQFLSAGG